MNDEIARDFSSRLDRVERKINVLVYALMWALTLLSVYLAYQFVSWAAGQFLGQQIGAIAGGVAGVIAFFVVWLRLHAEIMEG
jgi:hypothetical protein